MSFDADRLMASGLLLENLPPVFTSLDLAILLSMMASGGYDVGNKDQGDPCIHNASKRGGARRIFSLPGPFHVRDQALFLQNHWTDLQLLMQRSAGVSASIPITDENGKRYVRITPHFALPARRLPVLSRYRYCLVADISRFYYSVYTHALPWAIHGKEASKNDRNNNSTTVWGNRLDFVSRQLQSGQTIGLAVGPDTSRVIAEILLCAVDQRFIELSGTKAPHFLRHVDDYWIGGDTYDECEKHLQNLRLALKYYQLDINEAKTRIISTKYVFSDAWPAELENELIESLAGTGTSDPITAFGRIVERATSSSDDGIIRSAIKKLDQEKVWENAWNILQHFLAQCAVQFPHSLDYVARVVAWRKREHGDVDIQMWSEIALQTIKQSAPLGRDSETVWALWLMQQLGQKVPQSVSDAIVQNNGGLVLAYLAHFPDHGLAEDADLIGKLKAVVEGDAYAGPYWPLVMELAKLKESDPSWFDPKRYFTDLLIFGLASLIDWDAFEKGPSGSAIENYGSDYDGEGDEDEDDEDEDEDEVGEDEGEPPALPPPIKPTDRPPLSDEEIAEILGDL